MAIQVDGVRKCRSGRGARRGERFWLAVGVMGALLAVVPVRAAQSLVYSGGAGTFTIPNQPPFTTLGDSRLEFRIHGFSIADGAALFSVPASAGLAVFFRGTGELCVADQRGDEMGSYGNAACVNLAGKSDVLVRIQRAVTTWPAGELRIEAWETATGTRLAGYCGNETASLPCAILNINATDWHGDGAVGGTPAASTRLAWLKWQSTSVPLNTAPPKFSDTATLADWEFEGNTNDSGSSGLNITMATATYEGTPVGLPVCLAAGPLLKAGESATLDANFSYPLDGGSSLDYTWQMLSGPSQAVFANPKAPQASISGLVAGSYTFQLAVVDSSGQQSLCTMTSVAQPAAGSGSTDGGRPLTAIVNYNIGSLPSSIRSKVADWQAQRFTYSFGGTVRLPDYNPSVVWPAYVDHTWLYPWEMHQLQASAAAHNFIYENALLHMKVDYTLNAQGWNGMDQFDVFESTTEKGVFLLDGTTYTDKTVAAYNTATADVTINDKLLLGYMEPFAEVNFRLATAAYNVTVAWQYWNGSAWATLAVSSDGTNGLRQDGKVVFPPPADWAVKSENGSRAKYWVRAVVTGGGVKPVASRILGDDWTRGGVAKECRGWDATSATRVNVGLGNLEYNPTPPAGASAKFRYQARAGTGFWANNGMMGNPSSVQNGKRIWGFYTTDRVIAQVTASAFTAAFFDDATMQPAIASPANAVTTQSDWSGTSYLDDQIAQFRQESADLHARFGNSFQVGANTEIAAVAYGLDYSLIEPFAYTQYVWGVRYSTTYQAGAISSYDGFLHANNPTDSRGIFMLMDNYYNGTKTDDGVTHFWERGNRGPMTALAGYHIGSNANTVFSYNSLGYIYLDTDEFYYLNNRSTLAAAIQAGAEGTIKNIDGGFSAYSGALSYAGTNCGGKPLLALGPVGNQEYICATKVSSTRFQTTDAIRNNYNAGDEVWEVASAHQALDPIPPVSRVYRWGAWFPAMGVGIGGPDPSGWNKGDRDMAWKKGVDVTAVSNPTCSNEWMCAPVWRRDFTGAIVLYRPFGNGLTMPVEFSLPSKPIDLGGKYYPLLADGTTGPGITSISLRAAEGAILMKSPRMATRLLNQAVKLDSVPNAQSVRVTVKMLDGSDVSTTCTSSPCQVTAGAKGQHLMRLEYLSAGGQVLASSSEQIVVK